MYERAREQLREYQKTAVSFLVDKKRAILGDQAGVGKTFPSLMAAMELGNFPVLVVGTVPCLYVWKGELQKWFNTESIVMWGKDYQRAEAWDIFTEDKYPYLITNYANIMEVAKHEKRWGTIIMDEIHLGGLLNRKSDTYKVSDYLSRSTKNLFLVTGTPMRKNPADLYAPLKLADPSTFKSYWNYVQKYCITIRDQFGYSIERRPANLADFREMLKNYMLRRLKKNVMPELPPKTRQKILLELSGRQRVMYGALEEEMMLDLREFGMTLEDLIITPNRMVGDLRLRQMLVCPRLIGIDDWGSGMRALGELVESELTESEPIIVYTPFREALPLIKQYLSEYIKDPIEFYRLEGQMAPEESDKQEYGFQNSSRKRIMMCVIKSGVSKTLHASSNGIFLGCEWSVGDNEQAEDRMHRQGQKDNVTCRYLIHKDTIEEHVLDILNEKGAAISATID